MKDRGKMLRIDPENHAYLRSLMFPVGDNMTRLVNRLIEREREAAA